MTEAPLAKFDEAGTRLARVDAAVRDDAVRRQQAGEGTGGRGEAPERRSE